MTINQKIDALKAKGHYREAGIVAAANGNDRRYGCHFGFHRSTHDAAKEAFYGGFDDFTASLRAALASN